MIDDKEIEKLLLLKQKVITMLQQRGDDICWRDMYTELAGLVGIDFIPELICEKHKMLANCERFLDSLYSGEYKPIYVEVK